MAVQKCIYDNLGRCVRTVRDALHDPPPAPVDATAPGGSFSQLHLAFMYLIVIIIAAILVPIFRNVWGSAGTFTGKAATGVVYVFIVYVSMCLAVFGMNHGFQPGQLSASVEETNQDLRSAWHWVNGG